MKFSIMLSLLSAFPLISPSSISLPPPDNNDMGPMAATYGLIQVTGGLLSNLVNTLFSSMVPTLSNHGASVINQAAASVGAAGNTLIQTVGDAAIAVITTVSNRSHEQKNPIVNNGSKEANVTLLSKID